MERKGSSVDEMAKNGMNSTPPIMQTDLTESTRDFYEAHAREYFDRTVSADLSSIYGRFLKHVKPGGRILDAGSGSGRDLRALRDRGFDAIGIDASAELARLAAEFSGATCLHMRLEDLEFEFPFDAAWACASLLHIPKHKLDSILRRIYKALSEGGMLFVSIQVGEGERLLPDGRFFAYYAPDEFERFLDRAGFSIDESWISKDTLHSRRTIRWLNIIARRTKNP